jgi:hypothetical protein
MPISQIVTNSIANGAVTPADLSTGAPTWDTSGNVGIGTSSPATQLQVSSTTAADGATFRLSLANTSIFGGDKYGQIQFVGNDSSSSASGIRAFLNGDATGSNGEAAIVFGTANTNAAVAERMRIDSAGVVTMSSSSTLNNIGSFYVSNFNTTADACIASFSTATNSTATSNVYIKFGINNYITAGGQINANGSGAAAFGSFSDIRLKENIVELPLQLNNILSLRPVEFDYIESVGGGHQTGFIAQEMQEIYPDAVGEGSDGMLTVTGWDKTTARLVKAIQEQQAIITELKTRIEALEQK